VAGRRLYSVLYSRALAANAIGAALAFVYLTFISPPQPPPPHGEGLLFSAVAPLYLVVAALVGYRVGNQQFRPIARWLHEGRPPTDAERELILSVPWRAAMRGGVGWIAAAVLFGVITATHHPAVYVLGVVVGIVLAGLTSTSMTLLLMERTLRPTFAAVLSAELSSRSASLAARGLGTRTRLLACWALGSGIALLAIPLAFLGRGDSTGDSLIGPVLFLVAAGLFGGGALIAAAARSVSEPVDALRRAVRRVEEGSLEEQVTVDDAGDVGLLQAGFNRMVGGLRERERIRDAFGTYVDRDVAEHVLREGTSLAGEEVEVTILVLDIRGFTGLAERLAAAQVVETLNRLFERIVPMVHAHGGHVDKYVGDGFLAVFGAPRRQADHADQALEAALEIAAGVEQEFGVQLSVGIGLNSGTVVAGNVGGAGRLEFSVIGDVVNVAARVESSTRQTGDTILISDRTRQLLRRVEVSLDKRPEMTLKGKRAPVDLYAPRSPTRTSS
jgi:adenylate cyclase